MVTSAKQASKFAAQSAFVFVGTVVKTRGATMEGLVTDNTAIVQVDRVVSAPDMFASLVGHQVTVRFKKAPSLRKGSSLTFFTNGWIFGKSIAVDVVGTVEGTASQAMATAIRNSRTSSNDSTLSARLASAEIGVVGKVAEVKKSEIPTSHISEHDPDWHEATIQVDEVIKGKKGIKQTTVLFPKSDDVRWYKASKYTTGQQGIWLLHRGAKQDAEGISKKVLAAVPSDANTLTALHPCDYLPLHELERVRALAQK